MKLYTRTGDDGTTGLFGGNRVAKDDPRVDAYGTVDELNACLGLVAAACPGHDAVTERYTELIGGIQSDLFAIGTDLATPEAAGLPSHVLRISGADVARVEAWIDEIDRDNEPMRSFILPGGTDLAARLHLARTVCRRAERCLVGLARDVAVEPAITMYLNRLGDLLFAMARRANKAANVRDTPWRPGDDGDG